MYNLTYLFSVLILVFLVLWLMLVYMSAIFYLKYLIVLIYIRGVVVFILYISCICWNVKTSFSFFFLLLGFTRLLIIDMGVILKWSDVGEFFWIYLFFRVVFSFLVTIYSLNLFKSAGSLRF